MNEKDRPLPDPPIVSTLVLAADYASVSEEPRAKRWAVRLLQFVCGIEGMESGPQKTPTVADRLEVDILEAKLSNF